MKYFLPSFLSFFLVFFALNKASSQCSSCTATSVNVDLSASTDTTWTINSSRSGDCCTGLAGEGSNCIRFNVTLNPGADLLNFTADQITGASFYSINCDSLIPIGTPACITGLSSVCISFCKPGGNAINYFITSTKTVQGSEDLTLREGCSDTLSVSGLQTASITWNSIFPGASGAYNSYLSCTSGCASTIVTPGVGAPAYIDYVVAGNPNTNCPGTSRDTIRVYTSPGMSASISPANPVICSGVGSVTLTADPVGGSPPYSYLWSTGETTQSIVVSTVGSYTVNVSDQATSCPAIPVTVNVTAQPTPATPVVTSNSPVCEGSDINLTATSDPGATYSWSGPNGFTSSLQNPVIPTSASADAGTYNVIATLAGCPSASASTTVVVNTTPAAPAAGSNSPLCAGQDLNLTATNIAGATYSWSGPNGFTSTAQNPTITGVTTGGAGTYSVTATVNGCTSVAGTVAVSVNASPAAPLAGSNSPVCEGQALNLTASTIAGATYAWTGPNGFTSALEDPTIASITASGAGTYSVTATVGGCTGPAGTTVVTVNPIPATPAATSSSPACIGQTLNLFSNTVAGATYSWTGPNGFTSSLEDPAITNVTAAAAGTYSVTISVSGCVSAAGTTDVIVNATPSAPTAGSNSPVCAGQTLNLTSSTTAGATYNWTGPNGFTSTLEDPSISSITTSGAGTYSVTVTVSGCTSSSGTTVVTVNPVPAAPTAGSNSPICEGQTLNLTSNTVAGSTYSWTGPNGFTSTSEDPVIAGVTLAAAGTYSVTRTVSGCTSPAGTVTVTVNPTPATPVAGSNSPICAFETLNLTANTVAGATYSWSGPNGFTSSLEDPAIASPTTAAAGTYSVTVTVSGCTSAAGTTSVTVNPSPAAPTAGSDSPVCEGDQLNLTANTVAGATYSWSGPNGFTSSVEDPVIATTTAASAGTYSVTVTVAGCTSLAGSVTVVVNPIPAAPIANSNSPLCEGQTLVLTASTITGASYSWSGPNGFTSLSQNPTVAGITAAGAGTYSVTATVAGCTGPAGTETVTVNPLPPAPVVTSNSPLCTGDDLTLEASVIAGAAYNWTGPNGFTANTQTTGVTGITPTGAGTYSVTATANGCTGPAGTGAVAVNPIPSVTASSNSPICVGATLNLSSTATAGSSFSWSGPNGFTSALEDPSIASATAAASGTYIVTATLNGCSISDSIVAAVNSAPVAPAVSSNSPVCEGDDILLDASTIAGAIYNWSGPNGFSSSLEDPVITSATSAMAGTYTVTVNNGCSSAPVSTDVIVNPTPVTPVITSNSPVCAGTSLTLNATSSAGSTFSWTGPNGFSSSTQNNTIPSIALADSGVYSVTPTLGSCTGPTTSITVEVDEPPIATAGSSQTVCGNNSLVTINGSVTGGTSTGIWSTSGTGTFSPGTSSLSASYQPSAADTSNGTVTLTLTSTNNGACPADASALTVTITDAPYVLAGADVAVCQNNPDAVLSGSVFTATGGVWTSSGDGTFLNDVNLSTTYTPGANDIMAGSVTIYLTSTGNGDCNPVTDSLLITITAPPLVDAGADQVVCLGTPNAILNGTVSGASSTGIWTSSGTGTFSPSATSLNATYQPSSADTANGSVVLTLTSTNNGGCLSVSDDITITYDQIPLVNAGNDQTVCGNNADVALNGSITNGGSEGIWTSSGTGTFSPADTLLNATYIPSSADTALGSVTLTLTSTNGCQVISDDLEVTITVAPYINGGVDVNVCENNPNSSLTAVVGGAATQLQWTSDGTGVINPSNTSPTINYVPSAADIANDTVVFIVTSTDNGTCFPATDTVLYIITPPPVSNAGPDTSNCSNAGFILNGTITGGNGTGVWTTSGTGTFTPNANSLNATYIASNADTTAGSVTLTLTSTNNGGCIAVSDDFVLTLTDAPVADAGPDQSVCNNNPDVMLTGSVLIAGGGVWSTTGNGTFGNANDLNTIYTPDTSDLSAGSVIIILTTTGNGTCVPVTDSATITFYDAPAVNAGNNQFICQGDITVTLNGSVTGSSTTGNWTSSGTGTFTPSANALNATYNLSAADESAGNVTLTLTSTNNGGCIAISDSMVVTITTVPVVDAGIDQTVCGNNADVVLNGTITGGSGTGIWTSSGGGSFTPADTALNATYHPDPSDTAAGSVTLTLSATNSCQINPDQVLITITEAPYVDAGPDQVLCTASQINLSGITNSVSTGTLWTTNGAGTFANSMDPVTTYTLDPGDTVLTPLVFILTTFGSGDCLEESDTMEVQITGVPAADFIVNNTCAQDSVFLTDNSTSSTGIITGWIWSFGNGDSAFVQNPGYVFNAEGTYDVTLYVGIPGCNDSITRQIVVNPLPAADFTALTNCGMDSVLFTDNSSVSSGLITEWSWMFGDGDSSSIQSPSHTYPSSGNYDVTLTVTTDSSCTHTTTIAVNVLQAPAAGFEYTVNCGSTQATFTDTSSTNGDAITAWEWIFSTGANGSDSVYTNDFLSFGTHDATLIITTDAGCSDTVSVQLTFNPPPVADFSPQGATLNVGEEITMSGSPDFMTGYEWNFGDSITGSGQVTTYSWTANGEYQVTLTVTDSSGCSDTASYVFQVRGGPVAVPDAFSPNGDGVNDILYVFGGPFSELDFRIFNEWGREIFRSTEQEDGWDGTYKEKIQPGGAYVYTLQGLTVAGEEINRSGTITIIK